MPHLKDHSHPCFPVLHLLHLMRLLTCPKSTNAKGFCTISCCHVYVFVYMCTYVNASLSLSLSRALSIARTLSLTPSPIYIIYIHFVSFTSIYTHTITDSFSTCVCIFWTFFRDKKNLMFEFVPNE